MRCRQCAFTAEPGVAWCRDHLETRVIPSTSAWPRPTPSLTWRDWHALGTLQRQHVNCPRATPREIGLWVQGIQRRWEHRMG